jgi:hypothetical protein
MKTKEIDLLSVEEEEEEEEDDDDDDQLRETSRILFSMNLSLGNNGPSSRSN